MIPSAIKRLVIEHIPKWTFVPTFLHGMSKMDKNYAFFVFGQRNDYTDWSGSRAEPDRDPQMVGTYEVSVITSTLLSVFLSSTKADAN